MLSLMEVSNCIGRNELRATSLPGRTEEMKMQKG
jgi:hypothetical protein